MIRRSDFRASRSLAEVLLLAAFAQACASSTPIADSEADALPTADGLSADILHPDQLGPCVGDGTAGRFSEQTIEVDGEQRYYLLLVPSSYDCRRSTALLVHFHGTVGRRSGQTQGTRPEEEWTLEPMLALAEREGFIVARPRARPRDYGELVVWQWGTTGDLPLNQRFTRELIEDLGKRYNLDQERLYASGFSNGTNMASRFLAESAPRFAGYGLVGGGIWGEAPPQLQQLAAGAPRIYAITGYRDYQYDRLVALLELLEANGYPAQQLFQRVVDAGHEVYGWHFEEMWRWLDRGERPSDGALTTGWSGGVGRAGDADLLSIARSDDGALVATASGGAIYSQAPSEQSWKQVATLTLDVDGESYAPALTDLCILSSGVGFAVGESGAFAVTADGGKSWTLQDPLPDFFGGQGTSFGYAYLTGIGCSSAGIVAAGYWSGASSSDGTDWQPRPFKRDNGELALVGAVAINGGGTLIGVGYPGFVGRGNLATEVKQRNLPLQVGWLNDVAAVGSSRWWVVGEAGVVLRSEDDGRSWTEQSTPTVEDLYAVNFSDSDVGMAVGAHGTAILTTDGGGTWQDLDSGLDRYLGDVRWLDGGQTAVVVGEAGTVLRWTR